MRQLYAVVAMSLDMEYVYDGQQLIPIEAVPTVVGPFKTKAKAIKAGARDWANHPRVRYAVVPLFGYSDEKDQQVTLTYERMYDPDPRVRRKPAKTEFELHLEQAAGIQASANKRKRRKVKSDA